ncbi:GNAT family N-acetyltransferase [Ahrensia sp. AH-315-G08]|nr:GNAT family N-acetyltransferase [Ahrensia sp. AH-315-G08]
MFRKKPADIIVQIALESDLQRIEELHGLCFKRGWSGSELIAMFQQPANIFLVARHVGKPTIPVAGFNIIRQAADEAEIISIAVDPAQRGRDIADALMRRAIIDLVSDRVPKLFLEVDEANAVALGLYNKLGFAIVATRPGYYRKDDKMDENSGPANSNALVMRLDLG